MLISQNIRDIQALQSVFAYRAYPFMSVDWNLCIICQCKAEEKLKCPLNGPGSAKQKRKAYVLFLENIRHFS
eukprot:m.250939 g.250939  ORF g.250939 m.250939 type:complete len:72 (+) comp40327_c0_seq20:326-541(+)